MHASFLPRRRLLWRSRRSHHIGCHHNAHLCRAGMPTADEVWYQRSQGHRKRSQAACLCNSSSHQTAEQRVDQELGTPPCPLSLSRCTSSLDPLQPSRTACSTQLSQTAALSSSWCRPPQFAPISPVVQQHSGLAEERHVPMSRNGAHHNSSPSPAVPNDGRGGGTGG